MKSIFQGCGVALITPFFNNEVDYVSLKNLINKTIDDGADALIILGTTGESVSITMNERIKILHFCKNQINNRCKFIVGTGCNNMCLAKKYTHMAKIIGADAVLAVTPYYNKTSQNGIIEYYKQLAEYNIPIIMYNVPSRTGLNIELSTIKSIIYTNPTIYGIKECSTDVNRINDLMQICKDKIAVYSGEDNANFVYYALGGSGCISVTANVLPKQVSLVYKLAKKLEFRKALSEQNKLTEINKAMFCEVNPVPVKTLLNTLNLIKSAEVRPPLIELEPEHKKLIEDISKNLIK